MSRSPEHGVGLLVVALASLVAGWLSSARERAAYATAAVTAGEDEAGLLVNEVQDYAIFMLDPDGYVATWNKGAERIKGYRSEEILGEHFSCVWPEEDVEAGEPQRALAAAAKEGRYEVQGTRVRKDGSTFIAHIVVTSLYERTGRLRGFSEVTRDITDAVRAEEERERLYERERASRLRAERGERRASFLADSARLLEEASLDYERTLERVARLAVPQVCDWALVEMLQDDGSIERLAMAHADPAKEALVREYDRRFPLDPKGPEGSPKVVRTGHPELMADEALEAEAQDSEHLRILRALGSKSAMIVPLRARGQTIGDLALVSGESGRRYDQDDLAMATDLAGRCGLALDNARLHNEALEREEDLRHQALHDALTRLPNRTLFLDRLGQALARSGRRVGGPALLFVDLDGFKDVNDTHGHATGDQLLAQVADRLAQVVRPEDTVSRFGGDEFTILCESITHKRDAVTVAERIVASLEKPFAIGGQELSITASVGIVFARGCEETPESLVRDGDAAMYRAKQHGPGHYQVFEQQTSLKALDRLTTEIALARSAEGEGFGVAYQPIGDLRTSTVVGVEALSAGTTPNADFSKPATTSRWPRRPG